MHLHHLTIHAAAEKLHKRELSSHELTQAILDHIQATDNRIHSYLTVSREAALKQAQSADR